MNCDIRSSVKQRENVISRTNVCPNIVHKKYHGIRSKNENVRKTNCSVCNELIIYLVTLNGRAQHMYLLQFTSKEKTEIWSNHDSQTPSCVRLALASIPPVNQSVTIVSAMAAKTTG